MTHYTPLSAPRAPNGPSSAVGIETIRAVVDISRSAPVGNIVEVGVWRGGCAWYLAELALERNVELHLFDTFTGIPVHSEIDIHAIGDFGDTDFETVRGFIPCAHFHVGIFPDTLTDDVQNISVVHVDCDQYFSIKACIERLRPRMLPGGLMFFDDYGMPGAQKAVHDCGLTLPPRVGHATPYITF